MVNFLEFSIEVCIEIVFAFYFTAFVCLKYLLLMRKIARVNLAHTQPSYLHDSAGYSSKTFFGRGATYQTAETSG